MKPVVQCLFQLVPVAYFPDELSLSFTYYPRSCKPSVFQSLQYVFQRLIHFYFLKSTISGSIFVYGGFVISVSLLISYFCLNVRPPLLYMLHLHISLSVMHAMVSHNCVSVSL